jgi:hypothetical protein
MSGILIDQPAPGATTCIVIGAMPERGIQNLQRYRAVQWWIDSTAASSSLPASFAPERTQIAHLAKDDFGQTLERFIRVDPRRLPSLVITTGIEGPSAANYERLISETHRILESTHRTRFTRQQDGFIWQKHVLQNAAAYVRHRLPDSWAGALRGLPAFVCGAGPSLDVSIAKLSAVAGNAVIFSADSALRALARHGVRADFVVSIDLAKIPEKCLPPDPVFAPARVVLASVSPSTWHDSITAGQQFFISGNQLTDDWFAAQGVARTKIAIAESCGSTAIELARHLGCGPIYLFGLDLAVDPAHQAKRHQQDADPALYKNSRYDPAAQLPRVPGNYSETVPCFALGDWHDLDARLATQTEVAIFNVNDRGARLRGTTLVHPDRFSFAPPAVPKSDLLAALTAGPTPDTSALSALARLRAIGVRCGQALPDLRSAYTRGGPASLAEAFRPLLLDRDIGRALGAFALKLMPHLIPPVEGDDPLWQSLLGEFEELTRLARDIPIDAE